MAYQTKIRKARVVVGAFSSEQMMQVGNALAGSIKFRIQRGLDVYDQPAKPLKKGYAIAKSRKGLRNVRDWTWTGETMRALNLLDVNENRGRIGFADPKSDKKAHYNNMRDRQFGVSPRDGETMKATVHSVNLHSPIARWKVA